MSLGLFRRNNQNFFQTKLSVALDLKKKKLIFWCQNGIFSKKQNPSNIYQFQTTILCHLRTLHNTNFHQILCSCIWQEDYYYSGILFSLFVRNNHQVLGNIKLQVALGLKLKVIFFNPKW